MCSHDGFPCLIFEGLVSCFLSILLRLRVLVAWSWVAACCLAAGAEELVPPKVRELQVKATAESFAPVTVKTKGIVTWADPAQGKYFQIQDDTGGMRVEFTGAEG